MNPNDINTLESLPKEKWDQPIVDALEKAGRTRNKLFYTIPKTLLQKLCAADVPLQNLDPDLFQLEEKLADLVSGIGGAVGVWNGRPISYRFLEPPPPVTALKMRIISEFSKDPAWQRTIYNLDANLTAADALVDLQYRNAKGYCGWLLLNRQFIEEHDHLLAQWQDMVQKVGFPIRGPAQADFEIWLKEYGKKKTLSPQEISYAEDYGKLLDRWELLNLRAPYLPEPAQIQNPVLLSHQVPYLTRSGGKLLLLPANVPVQDRDAAREMLASMNEQAIPSHLKEWRAIVQRKNNAKNKIRHFERIFRLQHYWGTFQSRWGQHLRGKIKKVQCTFSEWLTPDNTNRVRDIDTIRKDLTFIAKSRGSADWCSCFDISDHA